MSKHIKQDVADYAHTILLDIGSIFLPGTADKIKESINQGNISKAKQLIATIGKKQGIRQSEIESLQNDLMAIERTATTARNASRVAQGRNDIAEALRNKIAADTALTQVENNDLTTISNIIHNPNGSVYDTERKLNNLSKRYKKNVSKE